MEEKIIEIDNIKADLNYEQLLGRAIDRCLFQRIVSPRGFQDSVCALEMALVDLPGKPLRSDLMKYLDTVDGYPDLGLTKEGKQAYEDVFKKITEILAKYKLLFKSVPIEVNR